MKLIKLQRLSVGSKKMGIAISTRFQYATLSAWFIQNKFKLAYGIQNNVV